MIRTERRAVATITAAGMFLLASCTTRVPEAFREGNQSQSVSTGAARAQGGRSGIGMAAGDPAVALDSETSAEGAATDTADMSQNGAASGGPTNAPSAVSSGGNPGQAAADEGGAATDAPAAGEGPSDPGVTDTEIRIGTTATLSGAIGFLGEEQVGPIDSYFQYINSQGGINGRKLRLITYDDRGDPSQTLANIRKLYEEDKVVALLTGVGDAAGDYVTRNQIPTLVFGVTAPSFQSKYPTVYPIVGNMLLWTQEFVSGLSQLGIVKPGMKVGMIYDTAPLDARPYLPYLKEAWEKAGAEVVSTDPMDLGSDCTSLVLKYRQLGIDWWDFQGVGFVGCLSAAYRQGYKPNVGWGNWPTSVAGIGDLVGPAIDGVWGGSQGDQPNGAPRTKTAAHDEYVNVITQYRPGIATLPHFESPVTIGYWSGAKILVEALRAQGRSVTKAGLNKWIQGIDNFDVGITPPIKSMAANCKTGSEVVWIAPWKYDADTQTASRTPATGYFSSPWKKEYGGDCFLTKLSDKVDA